ncbi:CATRA system-associated protein [Saccharothrix deserti]|uniref:CATRA system-associated protein n=1 Tax=Saccharothrix deserti TaxID=2593674 RepID=UPI00131D4092|nr:CATRA system-associated protein [Saccharothrix deserti]
MSTVSDDEIRDDAREVALDVLGWRTTSAEWEEIAELLASAITATEAGDRQALRAATIALELASPLRITRLGDERRDREPPPEPVRERVNRLVHVLDDQPDRPVPEAPSR